MKKLISILLAAVMLFSLSPMSFADEPVTYDLWVNGQQFTSEKLKIDCSAVSFLSINQGYAVYDVESNTLTLTNACIKAGHEADGALYGVYCNVQGLKIMVEGTNTITIDGDGTHSTVYGIGGPVTPEVEFKVDATLSIETSTSLKESVVTRVFETALTRTNWEFTNGTLTDANVVMKFAYTITLDPNGGTLPEGKDQVLAIAGQECELPIPEKEGYSFKGWYTDTTGGTKRADADDPKYEPTQSERLYAIWETQTYKVTFKSNGGDGGSMYSQTLTYNVPAKLTKNAFTKAGYRFLGWSEDPTATSATYTDEQEVTNLNTTLYAVWSNKYTVTAQVVESEFASGAPTYSITGSVNESGFIGSLVASSFEVESTDKITVTATPLGQAYAVIYDGDTGAVLKASEGFGSTATYELTQADIEKEINIEIKFSTYALCSIEYKDQGGGEYSGSNLEELPTVHFAGIETELDDGVKEGYNFAGWYYDQDCTGEKVEAIAAGVIIDSTLYAKWEPITYKVHFNGSSADSGTMDDQQIAYNTATALTANAFVKNGSKFLGWATESGSTTVAYANGAKVENLAKTQDAVVNLYAVWGEYTVYLQLYSSTGASSTKYSGSQSGTITTTATAVKLSSTDNTLTVTATPTSTYYAKIYTDSDANGNYVCFASSSSKGSAATYTLTKADIEAEITVKVLYSYNPITGDSFDPMLWVIAMAAATAGAAITIAAKKKAHS